LRGTLQLFQRPDTLLNYFFGIFPAEMGLLAKHFVRCKAQRSFHNYVHPVPSEPMTMAPIIVGSIKFCLR
jgi:hypothetical protein